MENENYCIEMLRYLDKAESDARKHIVYFSTLKGQVLKSFPILNANEAKDCAHILM